MIAIASRHRYALVAALAIAAAGLLRAPALQVGFAVDDVAQVAMVEGSYPVARGAAERFTFSSGDPDELRTLRDAGYFPWWADDALRLSLLRALPSLSLGLDHALFGRHALGYHLHSLLWWLLLCALVAVLLVRLLPRRLAVLALLVYLLDGAHTTALGWLANRNATMASVAMLVALLGYHRHRQADKPTGRALYVGGVVCAMCCGEYALTYAGYFLAHALFLERGSLGTRLRGLAPLALSGAAFVALRAALGFGARHSAGYIEPLDAPGRFAGALLLRLPTLIGDAVLSLPSDYFAQGFPQATDWYRAGHVGRDWLFDPSAGWPLLVAVGLAGAALFALAVRVAGARSACQPVVRFAGLGALLALLPLVGSLPSSRHMLAPQLGVAIVTAVALERGLLLLRGGGLRSLGPFLLAAVLAWSQLWQSPAAAFGDAPRLARYAAATRHAALALPGGEALRARRLYIVASDDPTLMIYVPLLRSLHGLPAPRSAHVLSGSAYPVVLERTGERTLGLAYLFDGHLLASAFASIFRSPDRPMRPGDRVELPGLQVRVEAVGPHGSPTRFSMQFDRSLDDPRLMFVHQTMGLQLRPMRMPPVGKRVVVSAGPLP